MSPLSMTTLPAVPSAALLQQNRQADEAQRFVRSAGKNSGEAEIRGAFQKFVAGTFYQQMLKSLRKMHNRPAYFHGGQAEEIFRNQLDQQVAENLAEKQGETLSGPLYQAFAQQLRQKLQAAAP